MNDAEQPMRRKTLRSLDEPAIGIDYKKLTSSICSGYPSEWYFFFVTICIALNFFDRS